MDDERLDLLAKVVPTHKCSSMCGLEDCRQPCEYDAPHPIAPHRCTSNHVW
jgi:hypothetical protein